MSANQGAKGAARPSVLDHTFGDGPPLTVGIEEEYMLLDEVAFDLVSGVEPLLEAALDGPYAEQLKPELMQCVLESGTVVCDDVPAAEADLRGIRSYAARIAREHGMRLGASATHPFSLYEHQKITARDRYRMLVEMLQYVARRELVFGMHVHVAVPTPEAAMQVMEGVLIELPVLLALSANSPFWRGEVTGLHSTRSMIFASFPRSGISPRFESYQAYVDAVGFMEATGAIGDYTHLWWDVRPHPRFGTVELRVMDVQSRVEDTVALAAYVQCLVKQILDEIDAGNPPVAFNRMLLSENKWLAARYGLEAPLMDLGAGKRIKMPARMLAKRRLKELRPIARELGCSEQLARVEWIAENGTGSQRQLQVWNANRDIREVAEEIANATEAV
ncbi:MAG: glutamate---cysteine ligase / carboxylate-amine ligase [Gaiellales bacterium]|jgi:carboxylate-amine ligase|nr:glutamate---cysteine ligase / carboxylate-amine ligase [Gaiellales bacterium]MDX6546448.1 glutamate---cysteine ligase / carboxylate-amine ligase [Gaiellales bacterium]